MWIVFIVLVWYAHEVFQSIVNSSYYQVGGLVARPHEVEQRPRKREVFLMP